MVTRWLNFMAFLASSANPERAAIGQGTLTVAPTCRVKGHPEVELTFKCGDGKNAGVVQYWHTPFGHLRTPGFHRKWDPVIMHRDGGLVVHNASTLHSGMYYCLLQHTEGTTLWPYELHVGHNNQKNQEHSEYKQCDAFRFRRDAESVEERQAGVSDGHYAGAVAASVLLTFVVGFSAGALTRTHVLRCLGAVTTQFQSLRQHRCQTDTLEDGSEVTMTTLPPMYENQAFEMEQVQDNDDYENCATVETMNSSTTTSPPTKPQRSFRKKREEEQETTAYLEGCDYMQEDEEKKKGCHGEAEEEKEFSGFYLLGEDRGSQTEADKDKCSENEEEKDGREDREKKKEWRQKEEVEENRSKEEEENMRGSEEEEEKERDEKRQEEVDDCEKKREEDGETDICSEDEETGKQEERRETPTSPGRRSRVIRLYQYDEDGQRYGHLPEPGPNEPGPRLKQRSLSLTRLNAIMAAASAGPLDTGETGSEARPHFHMEI